MTYHRLNETEVLAMRQLRADGTSLKAISEAYGCTISNCWRVVTGSSWSHLPNAQPAGNRYDYRTLDGRLNLDGQVSA